MSLLAKFFRSIPTEKRKRKKYIDELDRKAFEKNLNTVFNLDVFSINAFFTALIDFEHSGSDMNLNSLHNNQEQRWLYFGVTYENQMSVYGLQTKNLYPLCEFITVNNLWGKNFNDVIDSIQEQGRTDLHEAIRSYPELSLKIAYAVVNQVGHEKLSSLPPYEAGLWAINIIRKAKGERVTKGLFAFVIFWLRKLSLHAFKLGIVGMLIYLSWKVVSGGYLGVIFGAVI